MSVRVRRSGASARRSACCRRATSGSASSAPRAPKAVDSSSRAGASASSIERRGSLSTSMGRPGGPGIPAGYRPPPIVPGDSASGGDRNWSSTLCRARQLRRRDQAGRAPLAWCQPTGDQLADARGTTDQLGIGVRAAEPDSRTPRGAGRDRCPNRCTPRTSRSRTIGRRPKNMNGDRTLRITAEEERRAGPGPQRGQGGATWMARGVIGSSRQHSNGVDRLCSASRLRGWTADVLPEADAVDVGREDGAAEDGVVDDGRGHRRSPRTNPGAPGRL